MKIGLISGSPISDIGGLQQHVISLYQILKKNGLDVKIISPNINEKTDKNRDIIWIGKCSIFNIKGYKWYITKPNKEKIKEVLERERFDILHFHDVNIFASFYILEKSNSKNIITFHTTPESKLYNFVKKNVEVIFKIYSKDIHGIICVSSATLNHFNFIKKYYSGPIKIIPNFINIKKFHLQSKKIKEFSDGKINILFVGRLTKRKGLKYLIESYEKIKDKDKKIRLLVVGDGPERKTYEKLIKEKNIEDIIFLGRKNNDELPQYYASADIFCSPATYGESFGIVLLEAMASGKPIVAFANEGYKELLTGKGAEFLVEPKDVDGLTKKLEILIKNKKLREKMGKWGLKEAKKYDWKVVGKHIIEFYKESLKVE